MNSFSNISDPRVALARLPEASYEAAAVQDALTECCAALGWNHPERGAFGNVIKKGDRVVIKPNWVLHANQGTGGMRPLVTHQSVITTVAREVIKAEPKSFIIGDAPIQMCDWQRLMSVTQMDEWADDLERSEPSFRGLRDFRRTTCEFRNGIRFAKEGLRGEDEYVLFNLGEDSLLEPITKKAGDFRVTSYDPRLMEKTHSPKNHQYLIAREVLDADVVLNVPKLKTHRKAGISSALKNLVGINGNKEYLPHHRVGGSDEGGDCYPGRDRIKRTLELLFDQRNKSESAFGAKSIQLLERQLQRVLRLKGDRLGVEGAWSGNETVARMTIDLNRILLFGRTDGTLDSTVQRRILNVVDAVVAGQGDGPLANDEFELGMILAGSSQLALDVTGARLLGYDPKKIPLLRLAFGDYKWRITDFDWEAVAELDTPSTTQWNGSSHANASSHPTGWLDAVARRNSSID